MFQKSVPARLVHAALEAALRERLAREAGGQHVRVRHRHRGIGERDDVTADLEPRRLRRELAPDSRSGRSQLWS